MVWFRVGCCERCGGVGSRGERGSGTEAAGLARYWTASPALPASSPRCGLVRGSGGTIPLGGGGGGYVAQGLVHICISSVPLGTIGNIQQTKLIFCPAG